LLQPGEEITFMRGPKHNPWWERYLTHPAFILLGVALCLFWGYVTWLLDDSGAWAGVKTFAPLVMIGIMIASVFVLAISCGHFTRLVVTNYRLVILQGYEVCRAWELHKLPRSLLHYSHAAAEDPRPAVDLEVLQSLLGPASDQIAGAKTILSFGKSLDAIKKREEGRS
jgi:hypothetical protein